MILTNKIRSVMAFPKTHIGASLSIFKKELAVACFLSAIINLLMLAPTLYMLQIFDRIFISQSVLSLFVVSFVILFFYFIQAISEHLRSSLIIGLSIKIDQELNSKVFAAAYTEQLKSFNKSPTQLFNDLNSFRQWLTGAGLFAILDVPWTPIYIYVMFLLHPLLGFASVVFILVLISFTSLAHYFSKSKFDETLEERELNNFIFSKLNNVELVEALGMTTKFKNLWLAKQAKYLAGLYGSKDIEERITSSSKQLRFLMNSLAITIGAYLFIQQEITFGAMVAASLLMSRTTAPIDILTVGWRGFESARDAFSRLEDSFSAFSSPGKEILKEKKSLSVNLTNLTVASESKNILTSISARFDAGKVYLIAGRSGAGKSTLLKCLTGCWPTYSGLIEVNGMDVKLLDRNELGQLIGFLPQDIELFQASVSENISRLQEVEPDEVIRAAKLTGTHDFILRLPKGYDTQLSERAEQLSGGQRQRIALARSVYKSPRLIVLDEPNSNLDQQGDAALKEALVYLKSIGSTVFIVSHRDNIYDLIDEVLVIEDGILAFFDSYEKFKNKSEQKLASRN